MSCSDGLLASESLGIQFGSDLAVLGSDGLSVSGLHGIPLLVGYDLDAPGSDMTYLLTPNFLGPLALAF